MSIIQQLRDRWAPVIIAVIALSLIGFILMDAFVGRSGSMFDREASLGSINGKDVDYIEFNTRVKTMEDNYRAQGADVSNPQMRKQLEDQVWEMMVQEQLLQAEYAKLGITCTDKEMNATLFGPNPPQDFKQLFTDPQTGNFDINQARESLRQIKAAKGDIPQKKYLNDYIANFKSTVMRQKYMSLFSNTAFIPDWIVEKQLADGRSIASISYVGVPYATISDTAVKVTDEDIKRYISKRPDEYKQDANRSISYVSFDASASAEDSAAVLKSVTDLKAEFATAANAQQFMTRNTSYTPYFDGYVIKSKMQVPNADTIRSLGEGGVYGPYLDGDAWVMAKMLSKRDVPDSVKCRHILIGTQSGNVDDSTARKRIDSIATAIKGGANFAALAAQYSDDGGSKSKGGEYEFSSQGWGSLVKEFAEFIFLRKTGDREVVKTSFGYHLIEVMSQKNFEPAYKVAYMSKHIEPSELTISNANMAAQQFASECRDVKSFDEAVKKKGMNKLIATDIKAGDVQLMGLGVAREIVKWAYEAKLGNVSEAINLDNKFVVSALTEINAEGLMSASKARLKVEPILKNKAKAAQIIKKIGSANTLETIAAATAQTVLRADSIKFNQSFIPQLGQEPKIIGAAFNKSFQGKVTPLIEGTAGVFAIKVENVTPLPASPEENLEQQRKNMETNQRGVSYAVMEGLKKAASVKDKRNQ